MLLTIDYNLYKDQHTHAHGYSPKSLIVLHETVSPNYPGLSDIKSVSSFLGTEDYGIHGITDSDGNIAWAVGLGAAIFYHTASGPTGYVNTRSMGIEQISRVMLDYRSQKDRIAAWLHMNKELNATAKLIACAARVHSVPLVSSYGVKPGITTHYEVTKNFNVVGGHTDCWPVHLGGYYPKLLVIELAKRYYSLGYRF